MWCTVAPQPPDVTKLIFIFVCDLSVFARGLVLVSFFVFCFEVSAFERRSNGRETVAKRVRARLEIGGWSLNCFAACLQLDSIVLDEIVSEGVGRVAIPLKQQVSVFVFYFLCIQVQSNLNVY